MPRNAQQVRTRRLAEALEAAKDEGISITEFANRHNYNRRTVHRDMEALQSDGFNIRDERGRWYLEGRATMRTRPAVTTAELRALDHVRKLAQPLRHLQLGLALDSVHGKLASEAQVAQAGGDRRATNPAEPSWALSLREVASVDYSRFHRIIASIEAAIAKRQCLTVRYRALGSDDETQRVVEPATLHYDEALGSLYLIAWCRLRRAPRVFAVHRLIAASMAGEGFTPRAAVADEHAAAHAFSIWRHANVQTVVIRLAGRAARLAKERKWHPSQKERFAAPGVVDVELTVAGLHEISRWVLQFGAQAEVIAPPALREQVGTALREAAKLYEG